MNIDGLNGLACLTRVDTSAPNIAVKVYPLPHMPVIRDLVPDMREFYRNYHSIEPYLKQKGDKQQLPPSERENIQSIEQRKKLVRIP